MNSYLFPTEYKMKTSIGYCFTHLSRSLKQTLSYPDGQGSEGTASAKRRLNCTQSVNYQNSSDHSDRSIHTRPYQRDMTIFTGCFLLSTSFCTDFSQNLGPTSRHLHNGISSKFSPSDHAVFLHTNTHTHSYTLKEHFIKEGAVLFSFHFKHFFCFEQMKRPY